MKIRHYLTLDKGTEHQNCVGLHVKGTIPARLPCTFHFSLLDFQGPPQSSLSHTAQHALILHYSMHFAFFQDHLQGQWIWVSSLCTAPGPGRHAKLVNSTSMIFFLPTACLSEFFSSFKTSLSHNVFLSCANFD